MHLWMLREPVSWFCLSEGCNSGANSQLEQGHHEFPFTFSLPAGIPSSYECFSGGVRYYIKAKLEVGWKDSISIRQHFVVFQPYDLNDNGLARVRMGTVCKGLILHFSLFLFLFLSLSLCVSLCLSVSLSLSVCVCVCV